MEHENEQLIDVLKDLRTQMERQASLRFAFVRGLIYGLGTVAGATVLIGILGWFLAFLLEGQYLLELLG